MLGIKSQSTYPLFPQPQNKNGYDSYSTEAPWSLIKDYKFGNIFVCFYPAFHLLPPVYPAFCDCHRYIKEHGTHCSFCSCLSRRADKGIPWKWKQICTYFSNQDQVILLRIRGTRVILHVQQAHSKRPLILHFKFFILHSNAITIFLFL